jgi:hypothetical protein
VPPHFLNARCNAVDNFTVMMQDVRIARIAALYRAGSSTEGPPRPPAAPQPQDLQRARRWRTALLKSMAALERRRP